MGLIRRLSRRGLFFATIVVAACLAQDGRLASADWHGHPRAPNPRNAGASTLIEQSVGAECHGFGFIRKAVIAINENSRFSGHDGLHLLFSNSIGSPDRPRNLGTWVSRHAGGESSVYRKILFGNGRNSDNAAHLAVGCPVAGVLDLNDCVGDRPDFEAFEFGIWNGDFGPEIAAQARNGSVRQLLVGCNEFSGLLAAAFHLGELPLHYLQLFAGDPGLLGNRVISASKLSPLEKGCPGGQKEPDDGEPLAKYSMGFAGLILLAISGILVGKGINKSGGAGAGWVLAALPPFLAFAVLIVRLLDL